MKDCCYFIFVKHAAGEETDKRTKKVSQQRGGGGERAKTTRPTSAPSQPAYCSAQEMSLCSQKGRRWR